MYEILSLCFAAKQCMAQSMLKTWSLIMVTVFFSVSLGSGCVASPTKQETELDLSDTGLTNIPNFVLTQTELRELDLSHNALSGALPGEIRQLRELQLLDVSHNQMTGVPAEIGQLHELQRLDLSYNQLTGLPLELGNLQALVFLDLRGNDISFQDLKLIQSALTETEILFDEL